MISYKRLKNDLVVSPGLAEMMGNVLIPHLTESIIHVCTLNMLSLA